VVTPSPHLAEARAASLKLRLDRARAALRGGDNATIAYLLGVSQSEVDRVAPPGPLKVDDSVVRKLARAARHVPRAAGPAVQ
jgi:hypothetical protein